MNENNASVDTKAWACFFFFFNWYPSSRHGSFFERLFHFFQFHSQNLWTSEFLTNSPILSACLGKLFPLKTFVASCPTTGSADLKSTQSKEMKVQCFILKQKYLFCIAEGKKATLHLSVVTWCIFMGLCMLCQCAIMFPRMWRNTALWTWHRGQSTTSAWRQWRERERVLRLSASSTLCQRTTWPVMASNADRSVPVNVQHWNNCLTYCHLVLLWVLSLLFVTFLISTMCTCMLRQ